MKRVVTAIISKKNTSGETSYFLVKSKKDFGSFTGCWYPPGGKVEKEEKDIEALHREIREELGVDVVEETMIAETSGDVPDSTVLWFACRVSGEKIQIADKEIAGAGFFTEEEMRELPLWPATKLFFEKYIFSGSLL